MSSPSIPVEILDTIFEHAAHLNPRGAPSLSIVSKRIQICVEKIMYRNLIIDYENYGYPGITLYQKIMPTFRKRPAYFFATYVKSLCLMVEQSDYTCPEFILAKCTGLRHLGLWCPPNFGTATWILPLAPTLESLLTDRRIFREVADSGVTFPKLTYFWLSTQHYLPLPLLHWAPALEAVCLDMYAAKYWMDDIETIMSSAPNIVSIVMEVVDDMIPSMHEWMEARLPSHVNYEAKPWTIDRDDFSFITYWIEVLAKLMV
ncbi:hypothetical protein H0H87_001408 [Tephrocybe sp. NHM501043]|nr:hypothetical protein H0H87_001408 [Tephrocybe sp. NHM501043]